MVFVEAAASGKFTSASISGGDEVAILENETGYRIDGARINAEPGARQHPLSDELFGASLCQTSHRRLVAEFRWETIAATTRLKLDGIARHGEQSTTRLVSNLNPGEPVNTRI